MDNHIKQMVRDDINFNHNGQATYSQTKEILKICKTVYERTTK